MFTDRMTHECANTTKNKVISKLARNTHFQGMPLGLALACPFIFVTVSDIDLLSVHGNSKRFILRGDVDGFSLHSNSDRFR